GGRAALRAHQPDRVDDRPPRLAGAALLGRARPGHDRGNGGQAVRVRQASLRAFAPRGVGLVARGDACRRPVSRPPRRPRAEAPWETRVTERDARHEAPPNDVPLLVPSRRVAGGPAAPRPQTAADLRRGIREISVPARGRPASQTGRSKPYSRVWLRSPGKTRSPVRRKPMRS